MPIIRRNCWTVSKNTCTSSIISVIIIRVTYINTINSRIPKLINSALVININYIQGGVNIIFCIKLINISLPTYISYTVSNIEVVFILNINKIWVWWVSFARNSIFKYLYWVISSIPYNYNVNPGLFIGCLIYRNFFTCSIYPGLGISINCASIYQLYSNWLVKWYFFIQASISRCIIRFSPRHNCEIISKLIVSFLWNCNFIHNSVKW